MTQLFTSIALIVAVIVWIVVVCLTVTSDSFVVWIIHTINYAEWVLDRKKV